MKMVIQKVARAEVRVADECVGRIGHGLLLLVGLEKGDAIEHVERAVRRVATLRVFEDDSGHLNRGLDEVSGEILAVSQFTIAGSIRKGRRPSFDKAMPGEHAEPLFDEFVARLKAAGLQVATGVFGAYMEVELVNAGPVTLLWDDPSSAHEPG